MDPTIVDQIHFSDLSSIRFQDSRDRLSDRIISQVTQMQRFVRVRTTELDHDSLSSEKVRGSIRFGLLHNQTVQIVGKLRDIDSDIEVRSCNEQDRKSV